MKRKLLVFVLVIVMLASVFMTGCTFFRVDNEKKANEVMATVTHPYEGQTLSLDVTRNELLSYVNYIINLYNQYGMTYDVKTLVGQSLDGLINQKYLTLQGMVYLLSLENRKGVLYKDTAEYKAIYGTKITPEGVLTLAERYSAIATTNESFNTNIETYMKDYDTEQRELLVSTAKEKLTSHYANGYAVKEGTDEKANPVICYMDENGEYHEGLYQTSIIYTAKKSTSSDGTETVEPEVDYTKMYIRIDMEKSGAEDVFVYLPISKTAVTTEAKADADFISNYITTKIAKVNYDEPVKATEEDEEDTYKTHTAEVEFTLVTPRTPAKEEEEEEDKRDDATKLLEGDVLFRYVALSKDNEEQKKIIDDGQIFAHTKSEYASDAEKYAYRLFRDTKKNSLIGFNADNTDAYNSLGYYYLSSFETAILSAVQHEIKRDNLTSTPVTDAQIEEQYKILVNKQKEEYDMLANDEERVKKFAETVKTDLTKAYYVPVDALLNTEYEYEGEKYKYATKSAEGKITIDFFYITHILFKWDSVISKEMADYIRDHKDEDVKDIKVQFVEYLETNKSKLEFAENGGDKLEDAFFVNEDGTIAHFSVKDVLDELINEMNKAEDKLEVFKQYMTFFNDDNGSMTNKLGYFVSMGDIVAHGYDGDDFPNMARDLYLKLIKAGKDPNTAGELAEWAFTSYGMHLETISFAPFYNIQLTENNGLGINFALDLDGTVFADSIKETLESNVATKKYDEWAKKFTTDDALANATKNNKKMKNLMKDLGL